MFLRSSGLPEKSDVDRRSYSASRNGHDGTGRVFRPCQSQKNLQDGKGHFTVEVIVGNPEPGLAILHRGKDIHWWRSTGTDDYHRPVLQSDVTPPLPKPLPSAGGPRITSCAVKWGEPGSEHR